MSGISGVGMYRMNFWERLLLRLFPARRRRYEERLRQTVRCFVEHPEMPVRFR